MVNILVNNAQQQAAACCVPLTANIMVPPELPFENVDLCIILGNLLTMPWRHAAVWERGPTGSSIRKSAARRHSLIISISNSYNGQLRIEGKTGTKASRLESSIAA